jgi:hypothetical protein
MGVRLAASDATRDAARGARAAAARSAAAVCRIAIAGFALLIVTGLAVAEDCGGGRLCRCGDRVIADYVLREDIGPCPGDGLRVRRAVRLDGNGHLVRGSGARGSVGVQVDGTASGARIQNLGITGFERGLRLVKAERVRVEAVAAHDNGDAASRVGYGIDLAGGASRNVLLRVQVFRNADEGIHVGSAAHENRIVESEIHDNGRENVYFLRNHGNVLIDSRLWGAPTAVYVKHAARSVVEGNRISGGSIHLRGDTRDTRIDGNVIERGTVVLEEYRDKDAKIGLRAPTDTLLRGGSITSDGVCVRAEKARATTLDDVALDCPRPVVLDDASVVTIGTRLEKIRCSGTGRIERARHGEVRVVDAAGRPIAGVELRRADGTAVGVTDERGVHAGVLVESVFTCPGGQTEEAEVLLRRHDTTRTLPAREVRGDVRW